MSRAVRQPLLAANWKMFKGPETTRTYLERFMQLYPAHSDRSVVFFPAAISIPAFLAARSDRDDLEVGIQDVHTKVEGAYTGAVSAAMAAEAKLGWGLAGHSERRREFGDQDADVGTKLGRLLDAGLRPILCVGETLEERRAGLLEDVLSRQVESVLDAVALSGCRPWNDKVLAYEPVWAIGTGETATARDAAEAHGLIREVLSRRATDERVGAATILYGGSVKPDNIEALLAADGVDGVLVGGASLDPDSFAKICLAGSDR
ncbi:MAG: triose-phosphate isomerase [Gemmatimonadales bacterium]|jgi:triosephosphate isomerase